jgi:hypothetical protein
MAGSRKSIMAKPLPSPYNSKIIKAGALIGDTKTLLNHWDLAASVQENIGQMQRDNVFGKASRSRVQDILAIFRQRYLSDESVTRALVTLVRAKIPSAILEKILYFHAARADQLLYDAVIKILVPMQSNGLIDISVPSIKRSVAQLLSESDCRPWSEMTLERAVASILATLKNFGVLQGRRSKKIVPSFLPTEAFAYIMFYLGRQQSSGTKLIESPDWKLFFLPREGVERFLLEAHQHHLLEYHVAGSVVRLTFPVQTLEEYAIVLAQR